LAERALELIILPDDGIPKLLLDIALEHEVDGDRLPSDIGQVCF